MNAGDLDITMACGLRVLVVSLPEGIGSGKVHHGEYLWSVEVGAATLARGYCAELADARRKAIAGARRVLAQSHAVLESLDNP
jgi:hypothetical protein